MTNQIRLVDAAVFFQPSAASHGERVNIFGRNLPPGPGAGSAITVTYNDVSATIVVVAPNVITVEVPAGATAGPLVVTLSEAAPVDLGDFYVQGVILSPGSGSLLLGNPTQFSA